MLDRKLDLTFPNAQFKITGFKIFRYNQNRFVGGLLLYVNDNIPSKFLNKHSISSDIELIAVESMSFENSHLQNLMQIYDLCPLIKEPTCFQSHNSTCIGNFLTNQKALFKLSRLFGTGLTNHHRLISVVMKSGLFLGPPQKKFTDLTKNFTLEHFSIALKVQSCILYNKKYLIASTQITNTEIFTLVTVLVFKL